LTTRDAVVAEALAWVGTPFHANQTCKGVGADCIGVVAGVALACGLNVRYRADYSMQPDGSMARELRAQLLPVAGEPQPGDVLMMAFEREPHHVALYVGNGEIVHAYAQVRRCVRQPYDDYWHDKTRGIFSFPELA
jgi:cell wall-associated NlpC family hydrolase